MRHSINIQLPTSIHRLFEELAEARGVTVSDMARGVTEAGLKSLPFRTDKTHSKNLTFWVDDEYYLKLKKHAKRQKIFFKSMLFYWFIVAAKDVVNALQDDDGHANSRKDVG